ncbi:phenolic glucoside malonyltransferase 1-like [Gastrolobium bilobum]|uniref:phenolic glucoside malonyltransferase 1-like n=1 Tax=Gastrolobium bilobum TaxID=150636 RepID=UPI002AB19942|nr:phenolic glucoside malonyltransferase 1-like [Gastrolobium bilobum]
MAQPAALKVVQHCSVEPLHGTTTSPTPTILPITFFDLLWLRFPPVERLFFYEFPKPTTSFFDSVLPTLKHSLSLTLQHFLPLAGNITWPLQSSTPIIKYVPGDAVSFTIAESNASFNHLCSDLCEAVERYSLIPHLSTSHEQASVLALQVTVFPNLGFCIGITTHHAALDGKSSTLFMKSWAYACSSKLGESQSLSLPEHLTPFFDRSVIREPTGISEVFVDAWLKHGGPNNRSLKVWEFTNPIETDAVKGLFELTPSHIQKLKQYAHSKLKKKVQLSAFSVICAYVLACLVKAEQPKSNGVLFIFGVDCRSRLDPPILPNYLGNCIAGQMVVAETKSLLENDGFISALEGINEALDRVKDGVLSEVENWMSYMHNSTEDRIFSIAGSPRFEVYSIDFGWGRPKKVDMTSIDRTAAFSLSESRNNNGGIEIGLVLKKHEMEAFSALLVQGLESF